MCIFVCMYVCMYVPVLVTVEVQLDEYFGDDKIDIFVAIVGLRVGVFVL